MLLDAVYQSVWDCFEVSGERRLFSRELTSCRARLGRENIVILVDGGDRYSRNSIQRKVVDPFAS